MGRRESLLRDCPRGALCKQRREESSQKSRAPQFRITGGGVGKEADVCAVLRGNPSPKVEKVSPQADESAGEE